MIVRTVLILALLIPTALSGQTGQDIYESVCANCHGMTGLGDGPGAAQLTTPPVNFQDCWFAAREPDSDWLGVAVEGGPSRGFSAEMQAHGESFTIDELQAAIDHIRTLCSDQRWPRGELNLPRALITEKAFPEDEAVTTVTVDLEGDGAVLNEFLYERRFGPVNQLEVKIPMGFIKQNDGDWASGIGDLTIGVKRALLHSLESGSILSVGGEVKLPIGNEDDGFSKGTTVLEPFMSFGQILPNDWFMHLQGIGEFVTDGDKGDPEAKWRGVIGRTWTRGRFGRAWTPMVEVLGQAEFADLDTVVDWDVVPQFQVTLNKRQHVMLNIGARVPLTHTGSRSTQLMIYLLWDWFDGGFFEGW